MNARFFVSVLFSISLLSTFSPAYAHSSLDRSDPASGAIVESSPPAVRLWFNKPLEPAFSKVRVVDADGKQVDAGKPAVSGDDAKLLEVALPPLPSGAYKVIWNIVAKDGHKKNGDYSFSIK